MPYRQKDSANWWISYTDATGRRIRTSTGTTSHAEAKAKEQALRAQAHADRQRHTIRLDAQHTKTQRGRTIPLHPIAAQALDNCRARWPDSPRVYPVTTIKTGFAGACRRAGITDFTPHDLRHTHASWLVQKGVSLYEVRDILGHSSIKLTERYSHLAKENLAAAIAKL